MLVSSIFKTEFLFINRQVTLSANDNKWHHICVSWENTGGTMKFYKDGVLSATVTSFKTGHVIRSGGSLMLGQEQDSLASSLDVHNRSKDY